jgi:DNA-binding LytR/AlgR family response regulator
MNPINCLIVDDEPVAREIIRNYCDHLPMLHVVGVCGNALEAKAILESESIDILFLDINMPVLDGISFIKTVKKMPQVIFTTAYKEHAATAFDLAACDYLVKPFSLDRFIIAVDKALENISGKSIPPAPIQEKTDHLFIRTEGRIHKLQHAEIIYAEAKGNYTKIVTEASTYLPPLPFSSFEEMIPIDKFARVHRSYIINTDKLSHIEGNMVFIGKFAIPIGSNFKDALMKRLGL